MRVLAVLLALLMAPRLAVSQSPHDRPDFESQWFVYGNEIAPPYAITADGERVYVNGIQIHPKLRRSYVPTTYTDAQYKAVRAERRFLTALRQRQAELEEKGIPEAQILDQLAREAEADSLVRRAHPLVQALRIEFSSGHTMLVRFHSGPVEQFDPEEVRRETYEDALDTFLRLARRDDGCMVIIATTGLLQVLCPRTAEVLQNFYMELQEARSLGHEDLKKIREGRDTVIGSMALRDFRDPLPLK